MFQSTPCCNTRLFPATSATRCLSCPLLPQFSAQLLLSLGAKMELVNERDQTPYDLCINDGARETLEKWGYKYIVVEKGSNPGSPARPQGQSAAVASATAGLSKLAVKSTASPAAPAPKPA